MGCTTYKLYKYEKLTWYGQLFQYEILALENILLNLSNKSYFYYVELESIVFRQSEIISKICKSTLYQSTGLTIRIIMVRSSENNFLFYILSFLEECDSFCKSLLL